MIITVTMNPAIDKTVEVDKFQPYALNRIRRIECYGVPWRKYRHDNRKCIKCPEYPS